MESFGSLSPAKILLIDDDIALGRMLMEFLREEGFDTVSAFNGTDGAIAALDPDIDAVILDLMLPDIGGFEILQQIRSKSSVPVIMLTAKGAERDRAAGLEIGADDYIAKPYYPRELVARLRAVLRHQKAISLSMPQYLLAGRLKLSPAKRLVCFDEQSFDLTVCEFDLLEALLRSRSDVASKDGLSIAVLGHRRDPFDRSIEVHVSNLRKKLVTNCAGTIEIENIRAVGYRLKVRA